MKKELEKELKNKLEEERQSIQKELESFAKKDEHLKGNWETKYPNREDGDKEEEADEVQEYDNMVSIEHNLELRLKDVNNALEKIADGAYGKCENCGKEIEEERLRAMPETKLCMKCKQ